MTTTVRPTAVERLDQNGLSTLDLLIAGMSYMAPGFSLFFTTAVIAGSAGASSPVIYLFAGLGVLCTGAALSEFSRIAPSAGSMQVFMRRAYGIRASIVGGLTLLLGYICLQAAVAAVFGGWTAQLFKQYFGIDLPWLPLTVVGVAVATAFMVRGVGISIRATWGLFLIEFFLVLLISVAVVAVGGAKGLTAAPFSPSALRTLPITAIGMSFVFAAFCLVGFEGSISFAEETPSPHRAVPIAVLGGVTIVSLLYVLATYAVVIGFGTDHMDVVAKDPQPLSSLASLYASPLRPVLDFAIWTSTVANLMAAGNANARILFNMAREWMLPARLASVHVKHKTPYLAITLFMILTLVPVIAGYAGGWDFMTCFGNIAGLGSLLVLLVYMAASLALPVYTLKNPAVGRKPIAHFAIPALGAAIWLIPLWAACQPGQDFPLNLYPWIAVGVLGMAWLFASRRSRQAIAVKPIV